MFNSILVLESLWETNTVKSYSTWPFISEFANVCGIEAYYKSFTDKESLEKWISVFNKDKTIGENKLLYISSHGTNGRVCGINGQTICKILSKCKNIKFVHIGTCHFGKEENLVWLMENNKYIKWIAGYQKEVDWIDSTMYDILFWNRIVYSKQDLKASTFNKKVTKFLGDTESINKQLEFNIAYRNETNHIEILNSIVICS